MSARRWTLGILGSLLVAACGGPPSPDAPVHSRDRFSATVAQAGPDGAALYAQHCANCHGDEKKGRPAAATKKAIDEDMGGMGSLKFLTPAQLEAIAAAR